MSTYTLRTATLRDGRVYESEQPVATLPEAKAAVAERRMRACGGTTHAEVVDHDDVTVLAAYDGDTGTWHELQRWGA